MQYALLMMPIAAAIEEKVPATTSRRSYAKLLSSEAGKRSVPLTLLHLAWHCIKRGICCGRKGNSPGPHDSFIKSGSSVVRRDRYWGVSAVG